MTFFDQEILEKLVAEGKVLGADEEGKRGVLLDGL